MASIHSKGVFRRTRRSRHTTPDALQSHHQPGSVLLTNFGGVNHASVGNNPTVAASTLGTEGNGTTQAKFVPSPTIRVSMARRSTPFDQTNSARWSGMVTSVETATGGNALPSAHATAVPKISPRKKARTAPQRSAMQRREVPLPVDVDLMKQGMAAGIGSALETLHGPGRTQGLP